MSNSTIKNLKASNLFYLARGSNMVVALLILVLISVAYRNSFIQDDAFISFRYAQNLVQQGELTWNPAEEERVEGYTNFLWTMMIALAIALGMDPVVTAKLLGLFFAVGTLFFTYRLSLLMFQSRIPALVSMILLGTNYTFSAYATGGLETQLQTFLIVASTYLALLIVQDSRRSFAYLITLTFLSSAAILTRLDSIIPLIILFPFILWNLVRHPMPVKNRVMNAIYLVFPMLLLVGFYLSWKYAYYGEILPNSYYAKATYVSPEVLKRGIFYIFAFLRSYLLIPFVFLAVAFIKKIISQPKTRVLSSIIVLWCIYMVKVGGDFMEFRFLVPILPLFFILITTLIFSLNNTKVKIALGAMVLFGSLHHFATFRYIKGIEPISWLSGHIINKNENWDKVGLVLKEIFSESGRSVTIATSAAGAIPFYSQLPTVDLGGINDKWIARNGIIVSTRPGHHKGAPLEYLVKRKVNLVLGHPQVTLISKTTRKTKYTISDLRRFSLFQIETDQVPATSKVVEIPLDSKYKLTLLYLCRDNRVDEVIERLKLKTYEILRS